MALTSTVYRCRLELSDVDRGVYETVEVRVAQHPSESEAFLVTRILAFCLEWDPALQFGRGLCAADEPALSVSTLDGRITHWIEIGAPSAERINKATRSAERVTIWTHRDLPVVLQELRSRPIHRGADVRIVHVPSSLVRALEGALERTVNWAVLRTEGTVFVTIGANTFEGALTVTGIDAA